MNFKYEVVIKRSRNEPNEFSGTYSNPMAINSIKNQFKQLAESE